MLTTVTNLQEVREAIETRFGNSFDSYTIPVQYGNVATLKQGNASISTPYKGPAFVRLDNFLGNSQQPEVTRAITTMNGIININIFVSQGSGTQNSLEIADDILTIFNAVTFNGITTEVASLRTLPPNNGWYVTNLSIPYRWFRCN